jgi:hypothetical protein
LSWLASLLVNGPARATPPDFEYAWADTEVLKQAATVFPDPERATFRQTLSGTAGQAPCGASGRPEIGSAASAPSGTCSYRLRR